VILYGYSLLTQNEIPGYLQALPVNVTVNTDEAKKETRAATLSNPSAGFRLYGKGVGGMRPTPVAGQ
jgi:hypothetical protein